MIRLIDSHCHIDFPQFDTMRETILQQCKAKGMIGIVVPGVSRDQWDSMAKVVQQNSMLFPAFGLHPCFVNHHKPEHLQVLDQYLDFGAIAVGEIGLDSFHADNDLNEQKEFFCAQLALAKTHNLPIIVHARKTQDLVIKLVKQAGLKTGGIMHAFSGSLQQAQQCIELGFKIGFGGAVTYDRATKLRRLLTSLPLHAIVLETDAPDIPPSFARHNVNSPLNLFEIGEIIAKLRGESLDSLAQASTKNVIELFSPKLNHLNFSD